MRLIAKNRLGFEHQNVIDLPAKQAGIYKLFVKGNVIPANAELDVFIRINQQANHYINRYSWIRRPGDTAPERRLDNGLYLGSPMSSSPQQVLFSAEYTFFIQVETSHVEGHGTSTFRNRDNDADINAVRAFQLHGMLSSTQSVAALTSLHVGCVNGRFAADDYHYYLYQLKETLV